MALGPDWADLIKARLLDLRRFALCIGEREASEVGLTELGCDDRNAPRLPLRVLISFSTLHREGRTILAIRGEILNPLRYQLTTGTTIELATAVYAVPMVAMPKLPAFHSRKEVFHHDNSQCGLGVMILRHNRIQGTGQKPLCKNCDKLNDEEVKGKKWRLAIDLSSQ